MSIYSDAQSHLLSIFPPPRFLEMPAVGIDISDHSIRFVEFVRSSTGLRLGRYGDKKIREGIVSSGVIRKEEAFTKALAELRKEHDLQFVRASLPEEQAYLYETEVPKASDKEIRTTLELGLEENVPLEPGEAVFDYDVIHTKEAKPNMVRVVVSVFPRGGVEKYTSLIQASGLMPLSLEMEAQALARAVVAEEDLDTYMVIDFGKDRTGLSIVSEGAVRFATTVGVGGDILTAVIRRHFPDASDEKIDEIKNQYGLAGPKAKENKEFTEAIRNTARALKDEIEKRIVYWSTHAPDGSAQRPVSKILLCGGNANLAGLPEYLSRELKVTTERANVWVNLFSLDENIPNINFHESLSYASAIGLALHDDTPSVARHVHEGSV